MGKAIIKIKDKYFEWSTVVDAPITWGMNKEQLKQYIDDKYGSEGLDKLPNRLKRIEKQGHSFKGYYGKMDIDDLLACNRAGSGEEELTKEEIYNKYTKDA